jgi:hypothetical protein
MVKYFHFHTAEGLHFDAPLISSQCEYINENDTQCKNRCLIGLTLCWIHTEKIYKCKIKDSTIENAGKGLFAYDKTKDNDIIFRPGDVICGYNAEVITEDEINERYGDYTSPYGIKLNKNLYEDGALYRGLGTLCNHVNASKANAKLSLSNRINRVQIKATKNIRNNKEIFVNYGNEYLFNEEGVEYSTNNKKNDVK